MEAGARKLGYKEITTGNTATNSEPRDGRTSCRQLGFCFQGCKMGAEWSTLYTEIPAGEETGTMEVRPDSMVLRIEHDVRGKATGVVNVGAQGNHHRREGQGGVRGVQLHREPAPPAEQRVLHVPGRHRPLLGPGRAHGARRDVADGDGRAGASLSRPSSAAAGDPGAQKGRG